MPMSSGQATDLGFTFPKKLGRTYDKELGQSLLCLHQRDWTILVVPSPTSLDNPCRVGYVILRVARVAACTFAINLDTHDLGLAPGAGN